MFVEGTTGISMLATIVSEVGNTKKKVSKTITQQLFLIDRAISNNIVIHQLRAGTLEDSLQLDEIGKQLAEIRLEINNKLIPHIQELGQVERLTVINDISSMLDRIEAVKAKGISLF